MKRHRLAFFSPLPPAKTGIAKYSIRLLKALSDWYDIDCYHDQPLVDRTTLSQSLNVFHFHQFPCFVSPKKYNLILYQLGNSMHHSFVYYLMHYYPGLVDLHDVNIHHLIAHVHSTDPIDNGYARWMEKVWGNQGKRLGSMSKLGIYSEIQNFLFPLTPVMMENCKGLIVHSQFAKTWIQDLVDRSIPLFLSHPPCDVQTTLNEKERAKLKQKLGFQKTDFLCCAFGEVLEKKGCYELVSAFKNLKDRIPQVKLVFVGHKPEYISLIRQTESETTQDNTVVTGYVTDEVYQDFLRTCDIGFNLRYPSVGETSQTLLELMACGKAVFVSDYHQASEIPNNAVIKIKVGQESSKMIIHQLISLIEDPSRIKKIGQNARNYIKNNHNPEKVMNSYRDLIDTMINDPSVNISTAHQDFIEHITIRHVDCITPSLHEAGWNKSDHKMAAYSLNPVLESMQKVLLEE